ncbi:hypothetical protein [uncultured Christiangramia sp.]|uniref:hypothetical protein n=1 Tax=uncultured Christiangramia sp. TaxID=503836 RepID=UPI00263617F4|nr:hypothetical protein [uncultured Christiangramia sp.]
MFINSKILNLILILLFTYAMYFSINNTYISYDASYYLNVAKDISEGLVPYKDIFLSYTPLMMYMNAPIFYMDSGFNIKLFLGFQYVLILISAFLYYQIVSRYYNLTNHVAFLFSLIFVLAILCSEGNYINLEIYMILAVLSAIWLFQSNYMLLAGILLGVSFLFKQYGVLNFVIFYYWIVVTDRKKLYNFFLLSLGGIISLLTYLFYFVFIENVDLIKLLSQISGYDYLQKSIEYNFRYLEWITSAKILLLVIFLNTLTRTKFQRNFRLSPWFIGITISLLPTTVQSYQHYFLPAIMYSMLMLATLFDLNRKRNFYATLLIFNILTVVLIYKTYKYRDVYHDQIVLSKKVLDIIPSETKVFLEGDIRILYLLNNYTNPLRDRIGYSYFHYLEPNDFEKLNVLSLHRLESPEAKIISLNGVKVYFKKAKLFDQ